MTDIERDFKPSGRPTSMMAQQFSMLLESSFGLDETSETVMKKKEEVATRAAELEELEAKLAAMEERLKSNKKGDTLEPTASDSAHSRSRSISQRPYLRGPVVGTVRPETPQSQKASALASQKQAPRPAQTAAPVNPKRIISQRRQQRASQDEDDDSEEEDDSEDSDDEEDDSETSSSEEPVQARKK